MKYAVLLVFALLQLCCDAAESGDYTNTTVSIKEKIKSKFGDEETFDVIDNVTATVDKFCGGFTDNIEEELDKSAECVANITLGERTICSVLQTEVPDCFGNVVAFFERCLKKPGNELPQLFVDILKSLTRFFCESTGEQLLELSNPCLYKETEFLKRLGEDASQETSKYDEDNEDTLPSKAEVCKESTEARDLLTSHVETACAGRVTKEAANGFVRALLSPCQVTGGTTNEL